MKTALLKIGMLPVAIALMCGALLAQRTFTPVPPELLQPLPAPAANAAAAKVAEPEVDTESVIRRGNHVEQIGGFQQSPLDAAIDEVTGPPADDSHKFYITIISSRNCGPCKKLLEDWSKSPKLLAFAKPNDKDNSWAAFNVYEVENRFHAWFTSAIKIEGTPTILIQPPRNKKYGDPAVLIYQKTGYDGKADELAESFTVAIRKHLSKLNERGELWQQKQETRHGRIDRGYGETMFCAAEEKGFGQRRPPVPVDPPSPNTPSFEPAGPLVIPGEINPDAKPTPAPPDAPAPPVNTPESVLVQKGGSINVVIDSEALTASEEKRAGVRRLIAFLKVRNPGVEPQIITREQAKEKFPMLDTSEPQIITTGAGGRLLEKIPQALLDQLLKEMPALKDVDSTVATVNSTVKAVDSKVQTVSKALDSTVETIDATLPTKQQLTLAAIVGVAVFAWKFWRKQKAIADAPFSAPEPAATVVIKEPSLQKIYDEIQTLKKG